MIRAARSMPEKAPVARATAGQVQDDGSLLARMAGGDLSAFQELLTIHQDGVLKTARRILGDASEAEDVTQEAFLKLWQTAATFQSTGSGVAGWLRQVARNMALDRLRRTGRLVEFLPEHEPVETATQMRAMTDRETSAGVQAAIAALPDRQRIALVLFHFENMPIAEIARDLGTSSDAAVSLLSRARSTLRTQLSGIWREQHESEVP